MKIVELDGGAHNLEQARHEADPHADRLERAYEVEHLARVGAARSDDRTVNVQRPGQVANLGEPGFREGVGRPRRHLVQVQVGDDLRVDAAGAAQLRADRAGRLLVADEQTTL